jgi:hypothetical protein
MIFGKCEWAMQNFCISNSVKLESVFIYMVNEEGKHLADGETDLHPVKGSIH